MKTSTVPKLILASSSEPRQHLLKRLLMPFSIAIPNIDETPLAHETAPDLVTRLAQAKAQAVAVQHPNAIIIAADQVGTLNNSILGKPNNYDNAVKQLQAASGKTLYFYTGLSVLDTREMTHQFVIEEFAVTYRQLNLNMIERYLAKEQPFAAAGSCKAEGLGIALIAEMQGNDFTALMGLPLIHVVSMLENVGLGPI